MSTDQKPKAAVTAETNSDDRKLGFRRPYQASKPKQTKRVVEPPKPANAQQLSALVARFSR